MIICFALKNKSPCCSVCILFYIKRRSAFCVLCPVTTLDLDTQNYLQDNLERNYFILGAIGSYQQFLRSKEMQKNIF